MMVVKGLRWGSDRGWVCAGFDTSTDIAEVCVTKESHNFWASVVYAAGLEFIYVSSMPLIDVMIQAQPYEEDVDSDAEMEKCLSHALEQYEYDSFCPDENIEKSEFYPAIKLARLALHTYFETEKYREHMPDADSFIKPFLGKELVAEDVPAAESDEDLEEEEE